MEEERSGKTLWIILFALALVAALVFATLWYLRGGDVQRLNTAIETNRSAAETVSGRLERELRTARSDSDTANRKITELETRMRDDQRRAADTAHQIETRLRNEADAERARARDMESRIQSLQTELAQYENTSAPVPEETPDTGKIGTAGIAAGVGLAAAALPLHAEVNTLKQQLATISNTAGTREKQLSQRLADVREAAETREKELYKRLADAIKEKEELAGTVGDLKASLNNVGLELTTANEDLRTTDDLQTQLKKSGESIAALEGKIGDLEANNSHLRAELESTQTDLEAATKNADRLPELESQLTAAQQKVTELQGQIDTYTNEHGGLRQELSDLNMQLQQAKSDAAKAALLEDELTTAKKAAEEFNSQVLSLTATQDGLRKDLAAAYADLKQEREGSDGEKPESEIERRLAELSAELETARKRDAEAQDSIKTLTANLDTAHKSAKERESALAITVEQLKKENQAALGKLDEWRRIIPRDTDSGESLGKSGIDDVHNAIAKLEAKAKAGAASLREAESLRGRIDELKKENERVQSENNAKLQQAGVELEKAKSTIQRLENEIAELKRVPAAIPGQETAAATAIQSAGEVERMETVEPVEQEIEPVHYFIKDPIRSVGEISGMLPTGGFEIDLGSRQGVTPGMLFDIHRPMGNMNWFIGVLQIDRVMQYTAEATLLTNVEAKICPVTGRAVLDASSRFSPYVYADDNKPVPLLPAESLGLGGEMPVIGDRIDNPYFDPARKLTFRLSRNLSREGDEVAEDSLDILGGRIMEDGEDASADYLVTENDEPQYSAGGVLRVTPSQLSSYVVK